jgi:hypothetical protein
VAELVAHVAAHVGAGGGGVLGTWTAVRLSTCFVRTPERGPMESRAFVVSGHIVQRVDFDLDPDHPLAQQAFERRAAGAAGPLIEASDG